ncbi:hypothetical protein GOP47_0012507 [Adiantum capillus-veneris]|uniref:Guanine nucleotide-binding protein alpha subunit n=1 Tax=Adiantum capillus-veneris TaxID=13818 RepID=A0A9D4ZGW6_ADICA|nr:hypothetical protein GOP47_0012507 [Adiantum capillus-veneris]
MGAGCTKVQSQEEAEDAAIKRNMEIEAKREQKVLKLLLLGAGESGKSTIFKQIKVLFQTGFDDPERRSFVPVIHANVYQSIRTLLMGCKEFAEREGESSSKYILLPENQNYGERIAEVESPEGCSLLDEDNALKVQNCWKDPAIQAAYLRGNELQLPDCTEFFLNNVLRLAAQDYIPSQEDILFARQQTTGIVETEFSPDKDPKNKGVCYRLFDVGGQRNERRKWMHLFDGVTAIIFCASLSEYDQTLLEDDKQNRMIETRELLAWLLQQPWFENTSFLVFLNKFDIFQKKALKVPLSACDWFQDYQPLTTNNQEIERAYRYVERKFKKIYEENTAPSNIQRQFRTYRTTAIDEGIIKETFRLVDDALTIQRLIQEMLNVLHVLACSSLEGVFLACEWQRP